MGFPKPRLPRKALLGILGALLLLVVIVVWLVPPPRVKLVASDPRFHLVSVRLLTSPNEPFYLGSQTEGRVRDFLRTRWHLQVQPLPKAMHWGLSLNLRQLPERQVAQPSWLGLDFALAENPLNGSAIAVELWDPAGNKFPVGDSHWTAANRYCQLLDLDADRYLPGNYRVRVMQAGKCLAEFELRDLPRVRHTSL